MNSSNAYIVFSGMLAGSAVVHYLMSDDGYQASLKLVADVDSKVTPVIHNIKEKTEDMVDTAKELVQNSTTSHSKPAIVSVDHDSNIVVVDNNASAKPFERGKLKAQDKIESIKSTTKIL